MEQYFRGRSKSVKIKRLENKALHSIQSVLNMYIQVPEMRPSHYQDNWPCPVVTILEGDHCTPSLETGLNEEWTYFTLRSFELHTCCLPCPSNSINIVLWP